jgi:DNA-binding response OmpR family regulator
MDRQIDEWLRLKRIAVIGFDAPEAKTIVEGLRVVGLNTRALDMSEVLPGLNPLLPFDACVVNANRSGAPANMPQTMILIGRKPHVMICDAAAPNQSAFQEHDAIRDFVMRPINFDELLIRIAKVARNSQSQFPAPSARRRALVVDDEEAVSILLSAILEQAGFACQVARNAQQMLELTGKTDFDIVLLDIMMPGTDGFGLLSDLRVSPKTSELPIILVSGKVGEEDILRGFKLGADDYVTKPFNSRELVARVERAVSRV